MNRRKFFAFLPVAPIAFVVDGAKASQNEGPWDGQQTLRLSGQKEPKPFELNGNTLLGGGIMDPDKHVSMAVGRDGKLWLKSNNDTWKRIVTE